jgi:hypothetical protein
MAMKNKIQYFAAIALLVLMNFSTSVMAQPNPGGGGDPGGGPPVGGGAPIGGGIGILIALALAYGIHRWYAIHKQKTAQE